MYFGGGGPREGSSFGQAICEYPSFIGLAMQVRRDAVRVFKFDVHLPAVESECPPLSFAVPEDSSFHHKGVIVEPAPFDGVYAVTRR